MKTFIHTLHLLQKLPNPGPLPVGDILQKLQDMDGGQGQPTSILGSKHIVCWGMEDMLSSGEKEAAAASAGGSGGSGAQNNQEKDKSDYYHSFCFKCY